MNHMKEVAQMLGVELGEEFMIAVDGKKSDRKYKLTKTGCCAKSAWCACNSNGEWYYTEAINRILSGIYEIVKVPKPILDDVEKEYLSAVIKPFKDRVNYILKCRYTIDMYNKTFYYIRINLKSQECKRNIDIELPPFEAIKMYKGMELFKRYSLEELGL